MPTPDTPGIPDTPDPLDASGIPGTPDPPGTADPSDTPSTPSTRGKLGRPDLAYSLSANRWAVIVGISNYKDPSWNLKYARRDAEELYALLQLPQSGAFDRERMCLLVDDKATTQGITKALRSFLQKPEPPDLVLLFFASHAAPDTRRQEVVYLLTHDTDPQDIAGTALPLREIMLSLKENLTAKRVVLLADTCHSAAIAGTRGVKEAADSKVISEYLRQLSTARAGIAQLSSCRANELSQEDARWGGGHGVFTHFVLEGLRGKADENHNGYVTVGELFDYVIRSVKIETLNAQNPEPGNSTYDRNLPMAVTGGLQARERFEAGRCMYQMALQLGDTRRFQAAADVTKEAVDLNSVTKELPEARLLYGQALLLAGKPDVAVRELSALDNLERRTCEDSGYWLGVALGKKGDHRAAAQVLAQYAESFPESRRAAWARELSSWLLSRRGGRKRALLIGISEYQAFQYKLQGCTTDVRLIREALVDSCGFSDSDVITITDQQATRLGILAAIENFSRTVEPDDTVVIHFSGHAVTRDPDIYLVGYDFNSEQFKAAHAAASRPAPATVIGDYSGAVRVVELHALMNGINARNKVLLLDTHPNEAFIALAQQPDASYVVLLGASPNQMTTEVKFKEGDKEIYAGLMSYVLAQALKKFGPEVRQEQLLSWLVESVHSRSHWQTPMLIGGTEQSLFAGRHYDLLAVTDFAIQPSMAARSQEQLLRYYDSVCRQVKTPFADLHESFGRALLARGATLEGTQALEHALAASGASPTVELQGAIGVCRLRSERFDEAAQQLGKVADALQLPDAATRLSELQNEIAKCQEEPRRALLIGIDEYVGPDVLPVRDAVAETKLLGSVLEERCGFHVRYLFNREATRSAIIEAVSQVAAEAREGPALLYFAGNGSVDEEDTPTILASDCRNEGVFDISLFELTALIGAQPSNLVTIFDAGWTQPKNEPDDKKNNARFVPRDLRQHPAPGTRDLRINRPPPRDPPALMGRVTVYHPSILVRSLPKPIEHASMTPALAAALRSTGAAALTYDQWIAALATAPDPREPVLLQQGRDERLFTNAVGLARAEAVFARAMKVPIERAVGLLSQMITDRKGTYPEGYCSLGAALLLLGRLDDAAAVLKKALAQKGDEKYPEASYLLGRVLVESGQDLERAVSELERAVESDPDDAAALYYLGKGIRDLVSKDFLARAENAWREYLLKGAPLGNRDKVEAFLATRKAMSR